MNITAYRVIKTAGSIAAGLLATLVGAATMLPEAAAHPLHASIAFVGVNIVPMDQPRVLEDQTVLVAAGRIVAIGNRTAITVPRGSLRIDAAGRYLVPGLADMHTHLSGYATEAGPDRDAIARSQLLLYVASGVTLLRNMAGSAAHLDYRRRIAAGELLGPRIFTTSPIVDGPNPVWAFATKLSDPAEAGPLIDRFAAEGYDQIKVYNGLSRPVYGALMTAADRRGIRVVGHVPYSIGIDGALAAHQYSIEHQRGYDFDGVRPQALLENGGRNAERFGSWQHMSDARMRDLVQKTVVAGTWNCPTFVADAMMFDSAGLAAFAKSPLLRYVHPAVRKWILGNEADRLFTRDAREALHAAVPRRYMLLKMLDDAGAGLLIGTDTSVPYLIPGFTPIDEMKHFVAAGLTNFEALRAATSGPAKFLGIDADSGTVGVGKRADLLLIEGNPLEDINNLWRQSGVMLNGRWLARTELRQLLDKLADGYSRTATVPTEH